MNISSFIVYILYHLSMTFLLLENSNIYIETSKTSNAVRQLVKKMLDKYEIDFNNYNIFLRADASERYIK
jgi:uncharacterized protein YeeX (DUF496 family)